MAVPTLKVEIAFGVGPYATDAEIAASALGWVDVTDHVKEVSVDRGRSSDWDDSFVSSATVVLYNNDRKFDPFNVASPYFNLLNPRRQIKITGTSGATVYPIFRGYVNGFPVTWENVGKMSMITVDCFDVLGLVSSSELKGDLAEIYTKSLSPVHYYRCSDPAGTTTFQDLGSGNKNWTYTNSDGKVPVSRSFLGIGLSGNSTDWQLGSFSQAVTSVASGTDNVTISMWSQTASVKTRYLFICNGSDNANQLYGLINGDGKIQFGYQNAAGNSVRLSKSAGYDSSVPHHYLFTYKRSNGEAKIYVDGVDQTSTASGVDHHGINMMPLSQFSTYDGIYQEIAVFNKVLTPTEITNIYGFGAGNQVETTSARLSRLLALSDLPSEKYSATIHASTAPNSFSVSGVPEPSAPLIETLKKVQETEGGYLFAQRDGRLKSTERYYFAGKTSQATFTDNGSAFGYSGNIEVYYDGDNLRNDIIVQYGGKANSQASGLFDPNSIANNARHTLTVESQASTATEASDLSKFWLRYGIINPPTISKFEVGLSATTVQWQTLLGLELLDRITFQRSPSVGTPFNKQLLINKINFNLTPKIWRMQIAGSSRFTSVFTARDATGVGTSGSSTSFAIKDAPEVQSVSAAYTYEAATFSGQVNAKGTSTSVRIQYGTDPTFASFTELTPSPSTVTGGSFTNVSASVSGLTANTTYYFRVKAFNAINTVYGSGGSFTTYRLKTVAFTSSGTWTSPTWGGTPMTGAYYAQLIGGGGESASGYGGGGGAGQASQLNITLSSSMTASVGGPAGNTTLTNVSGTANAGETAPFVLFGNPDGGDNGDGTHAGGAGFYAFFTGVNAGGGGAGAGGAGGAYRTVSGNPVGGHGGAAGTTTYWGISYGGGGGGAGNYGNGNSVGSTYGAGVGPNVQAAQSGYAIFLYYGPSGNRSGTGWTEVNY